MSGPSPKPTALRLLEGNPSRRPIPAQEPKLAPTAPDCPAWVTGEARVHWPEIAKQLEAMTVATTADKFALGLLVDALGQYIAAKKEIEEQGATFTTEKGYVQVHPSVAIMTNAWERVLKCLKEFGLTPAARTKVHVIAENNKDEFESFMEKRA